MSASGGRRWGRILRRAVAVPVLGFFPAGAYVAFKYRQRSSHDVDFHEKLVRRRGARRLQRGEQRDERFGRAASRRWRGGCCCRCWRRVASRRTPCRSLPSQRATDREPANALERMIYDAARSFTIIFVCASHRVLGAAFTGCCDR